MINNIDVAREYDDEQFGYSPESSATGSGEPTQDYVRCCSTTPLRYCIHGNVVVCANCGQTAKLPTPAASQPTVTLTHDQRSYIADTLQMALKWLKPYAPDSAIATVTFSRLQDALALLRAAEQK